MDKTMTTTTPSKVDSLQWMLIDAKVVEPERIRLDATLDGCASVVVDVNGERWSSIRATLRRGVLEIIADDGTVQSSVLFAPTHPAEAYAFIAGWVAAHEE